MERDSLGLNAAPNGVVMILIGCGVMVLAALTALAGTGAGHGWMIPAAVTLFLFPIWPIAFWLPSRSRCRPKLEVGLGLLMTLGAAIPGYRLLTGEFYEWIRGEHVAVASPWFGIVVFVLATVAALVWLWRNQLWLALLPAFLLGLGALIDLGIYWQANYGPGPWGYRGSAPDVVWFFLWAAWHLPALWALVRAFDAEPEIDETFE